MLPFSRRAAGIWFTDGKSVLLLQRSGEDKYSNTWDLPGGHAKEDETPLDNAKREAIEELGIKSIPGKKFDQINKIENGKQYTIFFYKLNKKFKPKLNEEHKNFEWVDFKNLKNKKIFPKLIQDIPSCLRLTRKKCVSFTEWATVQDAARFFIQ